MNKFLKKIKSKLFRRSMYPELEIAGGLVPALNNELEKISSTLRVSVNEYYQRIPVTYARLENGNKFSQIYLAANEKLYLSDFWRDGVCLAQGSTDTISKLTTAVDYWLTQNVSIQILSEKFDFIRANGKAKAFDEGNEVEYTWKCFLAEDDRSGLKEFIDLASKNEVLSKLFPFTSLYTLCFSKCTGFPFDTTDLPNVTPIEHTYFASLKNIYNRKASKNISTINEKVYVVTKNKIEYIGEGNAREALNLVLENLPKDIEPSKKGNASTL